jgi:hypothetical protein
MDFAIGSAMHPAGVKVSAIAEEYYKYLYTIDDFLLNLVYPTDIVSLSYSI